MSSRNWQWIEHPPGVRGHFGLIPVGDSDFLSFSHAGAMLIISPFTGYLSLSHQRQNTDYRTYFGKWFTQLSAAAE